MLTAVVYTLGMIASWMNGTDEEESYLGGLNWEELIFNWHPILMVAGFVLSFIFALSSFRLLPFGSFINKLVHSTFHVAAIVCFSTGLYAVFTGNNFTNKNNGTSSVLFITMQVLSNDWDIFTQANSTQIYSLFTLL